jgi:hypothetical protein
VAISVMISHQPCEFGVTFHDVDVKGGGSSLVQSNNGEKLSRTADINQWVLNVANNYSAKRFLDKRRFLCPSFTCLLQVYQIIRGQADRSLASRIRKADSLPFRVLMHEDGDINTNGR